MLGGFFDAFVGLTFCMCAIPSLRVFCWGRKKLYNFQLNVVQLSRESCTTFFRL